MSERQPPPRVIRPGAVLAGALTDFVGSTLAAALVFAALGLPPEQAATSETVRLMLLPLGLAMDVVGGYVAAALARGSELNNAFVTGVVVTVLGAALTAFSQPLPPLWQIAAALLLTTPAATLGGWIRAKTLRVS